MHVDIWPLHGPEGWSLVLYCTCLDSIPDQSKLDLWWQKWDWCSTNVLPADGTIVAAVPRKSSSTTTTIHIDIVT
jgi:hypothetical protein